MSPLGGDAGLYVALLDFPEEFRCNLWRLLEMDEKAGKKRAYLDNTGTFVTQANVCMSIMLIRAAEA